MTYIFTSTEMDGLRFLGKTSRKMNDYNLSTPTIGDRPEYKCCEMKMAALVCLGCILAVILAIVLVCFIRRNCMTEKYEPNKQTAKKSGSQVQRYASVQQDPILCQTQTSRTPAVNDVPNDDPLPNRASNEHHFKLTQNLAFCSEIKKKIRCPYCPCVHFIQKLKNKKKSLYAFQKLAVYGPYIFKVFFFWGGGYGFSFFSNICFQLSVKGLQI